MAIEPKSGIRVTRLKISMMESTWTKMWDPPQESPATPERLAPTNPVPGIMGVALGAAPSVPNTVNLRLRRSLNITAWDGKAINYMGYQDSDHTTGEYPGPTVRVPRGVIFHGLVDTSGGPHTTHWHGIEPTPMNDGVGHCSMELGQYTYQWQPNTVGTYFYHCHRNTVQHFEFGLFGMLLIEPPNAFSNDPINPFEGPRDPLGYPRRTEANLSGFPELPGFIGGDPVFGVAGPGDVGEGSPDAFTIPYDVEALWVLDDRDSTWSDLASDHFSFYPGGAATNAGHLPLLGPVVQPGVDDQFPHGFFHDFNPDYFFVTGVPVPAHTIANGGTGIAPINPAAAPPLGGSGGVALPGGLIPPALNSGVTGMQIAVDAGVNQTVLVRCLNASYVTAKVTFPIDVVIIAWDGRALGVPPFGRYNRAFRLPAGTPLRICTARRFDALLRSSVPVNDFADVEFIDPRGENVLPDTDLRLMTARIPVVIS